MQVEREHVVPEYWTCGKWKRRRTYGHPKTHSWICQDWIMAPKNSHRCHESGPPTAVAAVPLRQPGGEGSATRIRQNGGTDALIFTLLAETAEAVTQGLRVRRNNCVSAPQVDSHGSSTESGRDAARTLWKVVTRHFVLAGTPRSWETWQWRRVAGVSHPADAPHEGAH